MPESDEVIAELNRFLGMSNEEAYELGVLARVLEETGLAEALDEPDRAPSSGD